ncbi:MAG: deoxyribodipyrimidine photo-lyase [Amaricoccus sp.]
MTALVWFRRDLRLGDHPALAAAADGPVVPVFVLDPETEAMGAAARWRLGQGLAALAARLEAAGSQLLLRRGPAVEILPALAREAGARAVHWSRLYGPDTLPRDKAVKAALGAAGIEAVSHPGTLLHEPWEVATGAGQGFRVFAPFWNALRRLPVEAPLAAPRLWAPGHWPASDRLADWGLDAGVARGAAALARYARVGEGAALDRLGAFLDGAVAKYAADRDRPDLSGTSRLSENLAWGEVSPRTVWQAAVRARQEGAAGAEAFLRELGWREFAWHLLWHHPQLATANWRPDWDAFPWRGDNPDADRWRRGMTGEPMVDAGMREMYVTGTMHNRVRMLTASYLTKHLMTDWRVGLAWFADCLIDWDPAANALNWQWVAGSGPDAAPYMRVFNPGLQAARFDPDGAYRRRFLAGFDGSRAPEALAFFDAAPRAWGLAPDDPAPEPVISHAEGRARALAAWEAYRQ